MTAPVVIATSHSLARVYQDAEFSTWVERIGVPTGVPIPRATYDAAVHAWTCLHSTTMPYDAAVLAVHATLAQARIALVLRHQPVVPARRIAA